MKALFLSFTREALYHGKKYLPISDGPGHEKGVGVVH
jgi:hypothetical protein